MFNPAYEQFCFCRKFSGLWLIKHKPETEFRDETIFRFKNIKSVVLFSSVLKES